jgi:serine phosphatase RsbU (regulator of sigma subunit)
VVDVPIEADVRERLRERTGVKLGELTLVGGCGTARPPRQRPVTPAAPLVLGRNWVAFVDYVDWATGSTCTASVQIAFGFQDVYERLVSAQSRFGGLSLGYLFMLALVLIGVLFLVIEAGAFVTGFALARSITGSIHELFAGTDRVRSGDFSHRIVVRSRDQLGELADSFNQMTASIEDLLREAAEKKRLEEELRIARQIQMSLLPRGQLTTRGLAVTALCVPAREVGGDYYDFFPLGDDRLGVLIADVSGKGTSAALYMAELKGLMLSLSEIYHSPKQLLVEANRIISANLDNRSFITVIYAVVDLAARRLTYARAGHTPLIYLPAATDGRREAQVLTPSGLVLGLRLDGIETRFEALLEESGVPLAVGDTFVFFTDGITEAMNGDADFFGETRLSRLVEEHAHLSSEELRERILREVEAFVGGADQHDDMTMILLRVTEIPRETAGTVRESPAAAGVDRP